MAKKTIQDLSTTLADQLKKICPDVEEALIESRKEREINKRTAAIDNVWEQWDRMRTERRRLKPDVVTYGPDKEDGAEGDRQESWSSNAIKSRKELDEKIAKYEKAINLALSGDCSEVYKLANNKQDKGSSSSDGN